MAKGEKTKLLWQDPKYRSQMREAHLGKRPSNLNQIIEIARSDEGRQRVRERFLGKTPWNKGKQFPQFRGVHSPHWKGGYGNEDYRERRGFRALMQKKVFERDGYKCLICHKGGDLQVEHIQKWSEVPTMRFVLGNCVTLCKRCHYLRTFERPMTIDIPWGHNLEWRVAA